MTETISTSTTRKATAKNRKRPPRGERIRRRRALALQRREEKADAVTKRG